MATSFDGYLPDHGSVVAKHLQTINLGAQHIFSGIGT